MIEVGLIGLVMAAGWYAYRCLKTKRAQQAELLTDELGTETLPGDEGVPYVNEELRSWDLRRLRIAEHLYHGRLSNEAHTKTGCINRYCLDPMLYDAFDSFEESPCICKGFDCKTCHAAMTAQQHAYCTNPYCREYA